MRGLFLFQAVRFRDKDVPNFLATVIPHGLTEIFPARAGASFCDKFSMLTVDGVSGAPFSDKGGEPQAIRHQTHVH